MQTVWKGSISFGLVNIPVRMFAATEDRDIKFRYLHKKCNTPISIGKKYNYRIARRINHFFAQYFSTKYPRLITIERLVQKRNNKLYFDYLQMWYGKTITSAYSPRATKNATISTPITWEELKKGIKPEDFTLLNISERLRTKGDIFQPLLAKEAVQSLDTIIKFLDSHQFHRSY